MIKGLNPNLPSIEILRNQFINAKPFRHICIDNFLESDLAEGLLAQFPNFDPDRAKNEFGTIGGKATEERVRRLGSAYESVDDLMKDRQFLLFLSTMCGIPDLEYDPAYFGGGTHDNQHGQELDMHVDFNRDSTGSGKYRRLNLLIYLNKEWEDSWGGDIEIHSNPREPESNEVTQFTPIFNRCVLFETHETSWHGFPRINLPENKRHLSRKSFSVYFYSKHAPECGETPAHATFYVQRWLPKDYVAGKTLTQANIQELKGLLRNRDLWIHRYQDKEIEFSREREHLTNTIKTLQNQTGPQLLGYIRQSEAPVGWHIDKWCGPECTFHLQCVRPITRITLNAFIPDGTLKDNALYVSVNGTERGTATIQAGTISAINLQHPASPGEKINITVKAESNFVPALTGKGSDPRNLSWMIFDITSEG